MPRLKFRKVPEDGADFVIRKESTGLEIGFRIEEKDVMRAIAALCSHLSCEEAVRLCDILETEFNLVERLPNAIN